MDDQEMTFFEGFQDELKKIALDISGDPKKHILMKQFEELSKGLKTMPKGGAQRAKPGRPK